MAIQNPCPGSGKPVHSVRSAGDLGAKFFGARRGCCEEGCDVGVTKTGRAVKHEPRPGSWAARRNYR